MPFIKLVFLPILHRGSERAVHINGAREQSAASSAAGQDHSSISCRRKSGARIIAWTSMICIRTYMPEGLNMIFNAPKRRLSLHFTPIRLPRIRIKFSASSKRCWWGLCRLPIYSLSYVRSACTLKSQLMR